MTTVTWNLYLYLSGTWTDSTSDVAEPMRAEWGIVGNGPSDLLAKPGELRFDLKNATGKYSPGHSGMVTGWGKGVKVKQVFTFETQTYVRFYGVVNEIRPDPDTKGPRRAHVTAVDWLEFAAEHPIENPGILTNQTGDEALETILGTSVANPLLRAVPIAPLNTDFSTGINVFPTTFDTITTRTRAYTEMAKIALSEISPIYLKKDRVYGETLVFENYLDRNGMRDLTTFPLADADSGLLLKEDGDLLLLESGDGIILDETTTLDLDNTMMGADVEYGRIFNRFSVYVVPRKLDVSAVVLFQLDEPQVIGSGETLTIKGTYADPDGGLPINAQDVIQPVITTDYLVNTNEDGSGSNISSDLTIASWTGGTEGFTALVTNGNASVGWVTKFNVRGTGIYTRNPIEYVGRNALSVNTYGTFSDSLTQKYKNDLSHGQQYANTVIEFERNPRTILNAITANANRNGTMMSAFLSLDVGDLIRVQEDQVAVDNYHYIQSVAYEVLPGNNINFTWGLKEAQNININLTNLAIEFDSGSRDGVNFGYLPQVCNFDTRTTSVWIFSDNTPGSSEFIVGPFSDDYGYGVFLTSDLRIKYYTKEHTNLGVWTTPANSITTAAWHHVAVVRDASLVTNDPKIFIDGTEQTLTEDTTPSGARKIEDGAMFTIGNVKTATGDYNTPFDGKIKLIRIYNRALQGSEISLLAAGTPNLVSTSGLRFSGPTCKTSETASYYNASLVGKNVIDAYSLNIGITNFLPVGREIT